MSLRYLSQTLTFTGLPSSKGARISRQTHTRKEYYTRAWIVTGNGGSICLALLPSEVMDITDRRDGLSRRSEYGIATGLGRPLRASIASCILYRTEPSFRRPTEEGYHNHISGISIHSHHVASSVLFPPGNPPSSPSSIGFRRFAFPPPSQCLMRHDPLPWQTSPRPKRLNLGPVGPLT